MDLQAQLEALQAELRDKEADLLDAYANIDELEAQSGFAEARALKDDALARAAALQEENETLRRDNYRIASEKEANDSASADMVRELTELKNKEVEITHSNTHLMKQLEKLSAEFERCVRPAAPAPRAAAAADPPHALARLFLFRPPLPPARPQRKDAQRRGARRAAAREQVQAGRLHRAGALRAGEHAAARHAAGA